MHDLTCLIKGCQAKVYAPAGTHSICREHFLSYLTWRRRKNPQMFMKYAGMTMEERDPLVAEWANTIRVEEVPTASAPKNLDPHTTDATTELDCRWIIRRCWRLNHPFPLENTLSFVPSSLIGKTVS